jgi:GNAT superfamily N-acetyltransferase
MGNIEPAPAPIGALAPSDADGLWPLSCEVGWNQLADDWRLMLRHGRGFGIRDTAGTFIASALVLPLGTSISWISMVIVTKTVRGRGLGTRLLARCLADVEAAGTAAGLDATPLGRPIYLPLGFRDLYPLSRWSLAPGQRTLLAPPAGVRLHLPDRGEFARIIAYDFARSGLDRAGILAHLFERAPALARVAQDANGRVLGFALARDGFRATQIGPILAEDEGIGLALMSSVVGAVNAPVLADVPDAHGAMGGWLRGQGASAPRAFVRMLRGACPVIEQSAFVFAIAGAELA